MPVKIVTRRKSFQEIGKIYFFTASIHKWKNLLEEDDNKKIILDSLKYLVEKDLIELYAFVIMPNHIHLIWKNKKKNKSEMPWASFLKYTAHIFLRKLKENDNQHPYKVVAKNKQHQIWRRDSLALELYAKKIMVQKLDYIHLNPVRYKRKLSNFYMDYPFSSARYYDEGVDEFGMLSDIFMKC